MSDHLKTFTTLYEEVMQEISNQVLDDVLIYPKIKRQELMQQATPSYAGNDAPKTLNFIQLIRTLRLSVCVSVRHSSCCQSIRSVQFIGYSTTLNRVKLKADTTMMKQTNLMNSSHYLLSGNRYNVLQYWLLSHFRLSKDRKSEHNLFSRVPFEDSYGV